MENKKSPASAGAMVDVNEIAEQIIDLLIDKHVEVDALPAILETLRYKFKYLA